MSPAPCVLALLRGLAPSATLLAFLPNTNEHHRPRIGRLSSAYVERVLRRQSGAGVEHTPAGSFSRRAYYGPLAPFRARSIPSGALPGRRWVRVRNALAGVSDDDLNLIHLAASPRVSSMAAPRRRRTFLGREVVGGRCAIGAARYNLLRDITSASAMLRSISPHLIVPLTRTQLRRYVRCPPDRYVHRPAGVDRRLLRHPVRA